MSSKKAPKKERTCQYCGRVLPTKHGRKIHEGKEHKREKKAGRKMFDGKSEENVVSELEKAFSLGCTDKEACLYADISVAALHRYQKKNPQFRERKKLLKEKLVLASRQTVAKTIRERDKYKNPTSRAADSAWKYLERKKSDEFREKKTIDTNITQKLDEESKEKVNKALENFGLNPLYDKDKKNNEEE